MYKIAYNTGAGDFDFAGSLADTKKAALENKTYTQTDIHIYDMDDHLISVSRWYGCTPEEYNEPIEFFGSYGFYDRWIDMD